MEPKSTQNLQNGGPEPVLEGQPVKNMKISILADIQHSPKTILFVNFGVPNWPRSLSGRGFKKSLQQYMHF